MPTVKRKQRLPTDWVKDTFAPLVAWAPHPFGPRDEADGARVGGVRLVRAPDGTLVGFQEPKVNR